MCVVFDDYDWPYCDVKDCNAPADNISKKNEPPVPRKSPWVRKKYGNEGWCCSKHNKDNYWFNIL